MKEITVTLAIAASVSLIVLSLILPVNNSISRPAHTNATLVADGAGLPPTPPPPPKNHSNVILTLDGAGLPPPRPPPKAIDHRVIAVLDGTGLPPLRLRRRRLELNP